MKKIAVVFFVLLNLTLVGAIYNTFAQLNKMKSVDDDYTYVNLFPYEMPDTSVSFTPSVVPF